MRFMGLDYGEKTIGVAISDPEGLIAQSYEVIKRDESSTICINRIREIARCCEINMVIVGMPRNMDGSIGEQGKKVLGFADKLKKALTLPIELWDERLSTVEAERILIKADLSRKKRKGIVDKLAAAVILQNYLNAKNQVKYS